MPLSVFADISIVSVVPLDIIPFSGTAVRNIFMAESCVADEVLLLLLSDVDGDMLLLLSDVLAALTIAGIDINTNARNARVVI